MRGEVPLQTSGKQSKGSQSIPARTPLPASLAGRLSQHLGPAQCGSAV